jgi:hypothetical protein
MLLRCLLPCVAALVACSACSGAVAGSPGAADRPLDDASAPDGVAQSELPDAARTDALDAVDSPYAIDADGDSPVSDQPTCFVDFPCMGARFQCDAVGGTYHELQSMDCHVTCGPGPCSGGSCEAVGTALSCPSGTQCVTPGLYQTDMRATPCEPIDGGDADAADAVVDAAGGD